MSIAASDVLPEDASRASLVGRVWVDDTYAGPRTVTVRDGVLHDLSSLAATASDLFDLPDGAARVRHHQGAILGTLDQALAEGRLLAPCDLQALKAAGVTFADSVVERVIEERARGAPASADALRSRLRETLGGRLADVLPGSPAAERLRQLLDEHGLWSQYLEVAIGPDPEIFTKAQPLSAIGCGAQVGVHPASSWSSSEPEVVLAVASSGRIVGASLGNDLTLRDFEGRSALLLGCAKDNNASCAIGPFVRLFDESFTLDDVRQTEVSLCIDGSDGFHETGTNQLARISRDPAALVAATIGPTHQYPDGLMLFLGTMYVPGSDRRGPGTGFSHLPGDCVRISAPRLGSLVNEVVHADLAPPWRFGGRALFRSLAARGLI